MSAALILGIFILIYWMYDSNKRKEKSVKYLKSTRGSRRVEKEEWEKWIRQLCDEYCQLAGTSVDFEKLGINPWIVEIDYDTPYCNRWLQHSCDMGKVFGDDHRPFREHSGFLRFTDKNILETLRTRHFLPSDAELKGTPYSKSTVDKSNYEGLDDIMYACVRRAVHQRGYRYGGTDFEANSRNYQKMKNIQSKYDYLNNTPKDKNG